MAQEKTLTRHWIDEVSSLVSFYSLSAFNKFLVITGSMALLTIIGVAVLLMIATIFIYAGFLFKVLFF